MLILLGLWFPREVACLDILKHDELIALDQLFGRLMLKVSPLTANLAMG